MQDNNKGKFVADLSVNFLKFVSIKIRVIFETVRHNAKVQPDVDRAEWGGGQSLFRGNIAAVKHKHWNCGVCSNKNRSMKAQRWNKVCSDLGWLCMLLQSYLAEHRGAVALLSRTNCLFSPSMPRVGSFMFPVVALGRRMHYQKTLTSIATAPLKKPHFCSEAVFVYYHNSVITSSISSRRGGGSMAPSSVIVWVV